MFKYFFCLIFPLLLQAQSNFNFRISNLNEIDNTYFLIPTCYLLGSVSPQPDSIIINGEKCTLNAEGSFLVYTNLIIKKPPKVNSTTAAIINSKIYYGKNMEEKTDSVNIFLPTNNFSGEQLELDSSNYISPKGFYLIRDGDEIEITFRATPGSKIELRNSYDSSIVELKEFEKELSSSWGEAVFGKGSFLLESQALKGFYTGKFKVPFTTDTIHLRIRLLKNGFENRSFDLPCKILPLKRDEQIVGKTKYDPNLITGRYGPRKGYKFFLQKGIPLNIHSLENGWAKIDLGNNDFAYLPENSLDIKRNSLRVKPAEIQLINVSVDSSINVVFPFAHPVPVEIKQKYSPLRYELIFYNSLHNIDWVRYNNGINHIDRIEHTQIGRNQIKVTIFLNAKTFWGYSAEYDGNNFILRIKKPLKKNRAFLFGVSQLKGKRIVIDPGHSWDSGAVGPSGLKEKDINFILSKELKRELEELGAEVFLTRGQDENLPLRSRKQKVISFKPDFSISMHNNAVPLDVNPLIHNGFSVYYYYPQSKELAAFIHNNFKRNLRLKDFGLYWDNLYMCRITETIALLVEPTFIIHPEHELLLKSHTFRKNIIKSIADALDEFIEEYGE